MNEPIRIPKPRPDPPRQPSDPIPSENKGESPSTPHPSLYTQNVKLGIAGGLFALLVLAFVLGMTVPTSQSDMANQVQQVREFIGKGQLPIAIGLAETALAQNNPPPSAEAKLALSTLWYAAITDLLFATSPTDPQGASQVTARWLSIEQKADDYKLTKDKRLANMVLSQRAYTARLWALSDAAFKRAWDEGQIGIDTAPFRGALLRNWGYELEFRGNPDTREQGVRLLATSCAIAMTYNTDAQACTDLRQLGYTDYTKAGPDLSEAVLVAKR